MSRIGKAPISVPKEVSVTLAPSEIAIKGPKGELKFHIPEGVTIKQTEGGLEVVRSSEDKKSKALHGFVRAELNNYVMGVTKGWAKSLEMTGVGYRAAVTGVNLVLNVGFSHPVTIAPPQGITFAVQDGKIVVTGIDKHLVGEVSASVRGVKPPEPYKGKGIRYVGEYIRKKAGKAKAVGGAPGAK